ncbi:MAG TPA: hypothetical protein VK936_12025 [Longimicrobiales bacterium]|nr:hypothetical protein [Longimicrobiales bacterium]
MLTLRSEQIEALRLALEPSFVDRLFQHVQAAHAAAVAEMGEPAARELVARCAAEARRAGLAWEISIADFVSLAFTVAPWFYLQPGIAAALASIGASSRPDHRFFLFGGMVSPADWEDARRNWRAGPDAPPGGTV